MGFPRNKAAFIFSLSLATSLFVGCARQSVQHISIDPDSFGADTNSSASKFLTSNQPLAASIGKSSNYVAVSSAKKRISIDGRTYTIIEGDILLDEDELKIHVAGKSDSNIARFSKSAPLSIAGSKTDRAHIEIIVDGSLGKPIKWDTKKPLTYAVQKNKFTTTERYNIAVKNVAAAAREWEETCGITITHKQDLDGKPHLVDGNGSPIGVTFLVQEIGAADFFAVAFFPNDPGHRRKLLFSASYFSGEMKYDPVGVMRHELGHILGFRHEHIRSDAPSDCPDENTSGTINVTDYSTNSVMHYFCGGVGDRELKITEIDREGARKIYGPPLR